MFISASALSILKDCPCCFWMEKVKGVKQPKGIFPSLPGGMDRALKDKFNRYRIQRALPPEISHLQGSLFHDVVKLEAWRNWRKGIKVEMGDHTVVGALDDLFVEQNGLYSPLDYKTRGAAPKEDAPDYYGHQLDLYAFLLEEAGLPVSGKAYLVYYWQDEALESEASGSVLFRFNTQVDVKEADPQRAKDLIEKAIAVLGLQAAPAPTLGCAYCEYQKSLKAVQK